MFENIPEIIIVGDIELFIIGAALALGAPKFATKLAAKKYGDEAAEQITDENNNGEDTLRSDIEETVEEVSDENNKSS